MEYWMFATANSKAEQTMSGGVMERKMANEPITIYIDVNSVNEVPKSGKSWRQGYQVQDRGPWPWLVRRMHGHRE
jgi:hypothetical protein